MILRSLYPSKTGTLTIFQGGRKQSHNSWGAHYGGCLGTCHAKRYVTTLFLKTKDQAGSQIKEHVNMIEKKYMRLPKYLQFDNGKELVNEGLKKWAAEKGIIIEMTAPYSPSQNGVAAPDLPTLQA